MSRSLRKQLEVKFRRAGGLCHWCKQPMRLYPIEQLRAWPVGQPLDPEMATIDHLYSKYHPMRRKQGNKPSHVIAHRACNARRAHEETKRVVELQRLKGREL